MECNSPPDIARYLVQSILEFCKVAGVGLQRDCTSERILGYFKKKNQSILRQRRHNQRMFLLFQARTYLLENKSSPGRVQAGMQNLPISETAIVLDIRALNNRRPLSEKPRELDQSANGRGSGDQPYSAVEVCQKTSNKMGGMAQRACIRVFAVIEPHETTSSLLASPNQIVTTNVEVLP